MMTLLHVLLLILLLICPAIGQATVRYGMARRHATISRKHLLAYTRPSQFG